MLATTKVSAHVACYLKLQCQHCITQNSSEALVEIMMSMTGSYVVHTWFMSLIAIKHCIVHIAGDNTLLAAPQIIPSGANLTRIHNNLTRIRNILRYGSLGGEHLYACAGHKCIAWRNPGSATPCMAQPR